MDSVGTFFSICWGKRITEVGALSQSKVDMMLKRQNICKCFYNIFEWIGQARFLAYAVGKRITEVGALSQSKVDMMLKGQYVPCDWLSITYNCYAIHSVVMHLVHTESGTVSMFVFYHIEEPELLHALTQHYCMTLKGEFRVFRRSTLILIHNCGCTAHSRTTNLNNFRC